MKHTHVVGFAPILNEIECLNGWIKNISLFCDEVWALYDPRSTDGTNELLKKWEKEGKIHLFEQNTEAGDSTRDFRGSEGIITYIVEVNRFIKKHVEENAWFLWLAADERIDPKDVEFTKFCVDQAEVKDYDSVILDLYDLYPDENHIVDYDKLNIFLFNKRFYKNRPGFKFGVRAHDNEVGSYRPLRAGIPFYHFGYLKKDHANWWRAWDGKNMIDQLPESERYREIVNPFKDWKK